MSILDQWASGRVRETSLQTEVSARATRRSNVLGVLTAVGMAAVAAWGGAARLNVWWWLATTCGGQLVALWLLTSAGTPLPAQVSMTLKVRSNLLLALFCSACWGTTAWLLLPGLAEPYFVVLVTACSVVFSGESAGVVYRPIVWVQSCSGPIVFAVGLLVSFGDEYVLLAAGFVVIGLSTVLLSGSRTEAARLALRLGAENERLLAESMRQQAIAEAARHDAEQAREKAEQADRGKTTFLAAAGHDLRQPLHALVQYHGHLQRSNHDPALADTVGRIGKSLDAMHDLLDAMLEVSKLLTGTVQPRIRTFRLDTVLDRLDAQLRPLAETKALSFELQSAALTLKSDDILLERILRNLTLNAVRYTTSGRVGVRAYRHRNHCRVLVWDTGIGIARSEQLRIFEEFYQVANEARDARKGLGLGLAIVRQLCDLLQIQIRLRSALQRGSVFAIDLPLAPASESPEQKPTTYREQDFTGGAFIVLVDDNPDSLESTAQTLRSFGAHVIAASSSLDAIDRLQAQEFAPQLIVSDYRLVGETGLDVIRVLSDNQKALFGDDFEIAALLVTGDTAPAELQKAQDAGVLMLHKPLSFDRLYQGVNGSLAALARAGEETRSVGTS